MSGTFANFALIDGAELQDALARAGLDPSAFAQLSKSDSLTVPVGRQPARGWFVMRKGDLASLNAFTAYSLVLADGDGNELTFNGLYIVNARCVLRGASGDVLAPYLVELTDARGLYKNGLFEFPTESSYNVRAPAYDTSYYSATLNTGSAWTWAQMVADLWSQLPLLGSGSGLPGSYTPVGTPEGWSFPGISCWEALCGVLEHLGLAVACDLTLASNQYSIVHQGDAGGLAAQQTAHAGLLMEDEVPVSLAAGAVPATVVVFFHRRNQYYGTEETVRDDSLQWSTANDYTVSISTGTGVSGTKHFIWDDFTVRYDEDSNPLSADTTTAATVAAARAADYVSRIKRGGLGEMRQLYAGLLPFVTGADCDAVSWRRCYNRPQRMDWTTEIVRDMWGRWGVDDAGGMVAMDKRGDDSSNAQPPMFGPGLPNYPVHGQVVRTYGTGTSAIGGIVYPAYTEQLLSGTGLRDREACYVFVSSVSGTTPARLIGAYSGLPLYAAPSPGGGSPFGESMGRLSSSATSGAGIWQFTLRTYNADGSENIGGTVDVKDTDLALSLTAFNLGLYLPLISQGINSVNGRPLYATGFPMLNVIDNSGSPNYLATYQLRVAGGTLTQPLAGTVLLTITPFDLTVQDSTGSPSFANINTIQFTHGTVSQPSANVALFTPSPSTVKVYLGGSLIGTEQGINFTTGSNIGIAAADNPGANRVDVGVAASVSGQYNSGTIYTRSKLNFVAGTNGVVVVADDVGNNSVDVTLGSVLAVELSGTLIGARPALNFIPGTNVAMTVVDNPGASRVDVTIASAPPALVGASVTYTGSQVLVSGSSTMITPFSTGSRGFNSGGVFSTNTMTVPAGKGGKWIIGASVILDVGSTPVNSYASMGIQINGTGVVLAGALVAIIFDPVPITPTYFMPNLNVEPAVVVLADMDYVQLFISAHNDNPQISFAYFWAYKLE